MIDSEFINLFVNYKQKKISVAAKIKNKQPSVTRLRNRIIGAGIGVDVPEPPNLARSKSDLHIHNTDLPLT